MDNRILSFENIQNARDLGGLRTADRCVIRPGLLIRSANLAEASPADVAALADQHHLARILDLRTGAEKQEKPDAAVPGAVYCPLPIFDESVLGISHEKQSRSTASVPRLEDLYRWIVSDGQCRENLGKAARTIMEHDFSKGAVLWHCTEGKDRCGLLTVVLLSALGVDRTQITADYLLTNRVNSPKAEQYYQGMLAAGKSEQEAAAIRDVFLAKESYLDAAFDAIDRQYKDMAAFLKVGLEIPEGTAARFRKLVLDRTM